MEAFNNIRVKEIITKTQQNIPTTGSEAIVMLIGNKLGIQPETSKNAFNTLSKSLQTITKSNWYDNDEYEKKFQDNLRKELQQSDYNDKKRTYTIQEHKQISILCFEEPLEGVNENIAWKRKDNQIMHNLQTTLKGNTLKINEIKCTNKGEYNCGYKSINGMEWTHENLGIQWKTITINVICADNQAIDIIPKTHVVIETHKTLINCPIAASNTSNIRWTKLSGMNSDSFFNGNSVLEFKNTKLYQAGVYQCSISDQKFEIILQVNKNTISGHNVDENELGTLIGYDCTNNIIKKESIDLTTTQDCNKEDYASYDEGQKINMELIHYKSTQQIQIKTCKMNIKLYNGYCRPGNYVSLWFGIDWVNPGSGTQHGLDAMQLILEEQYTIEAGVCRTAWDTGKLKINLGQQMVTINSERNNPTHSKTILYLHGSTFSADHFNCTPAYGWGNKGKVYRGQYNQFVKKKSHEVLKAEIDLRLQLIHGVIDREKDILYLPEAGKTITIKTMPAILDIKSVNKGTIILTKEELTTTKCNQHEHISSGAATIYTPTNLNIKTPKLIKYQANINNDERIFGFQIQENSKVTICNNECYNTEIPNIKICIRQNSNQDLKVKNIEILNQIGSNSINHLQLSIDQSLQNTMYLLCQLNKKLYDNALKNIEIHGPSLIDPINKGEGIKIIQRGEVATIIKCKKVHTIPRHEPENCCQNFPITILQENNHYMNKYIQPITRQIVDSCDPTSCTEILPVIMKNTEDKYICQLKDHISECEGPIILNPTKDINGQLSLLTKGELKISTIQGSLPAQIDLYGIITNTKIKATNELMKEITQNEIRCYGNKCIGSPTNSKFRHGLAKITLPEDVNFIVFNTPLKILIVLALIIFYYEKLCGIISLVVNINDVCANGRDKLANLTCCGLMFSTCCMLSKSLNPLHPKTALDEYRLQKLKKDMKKIKIDHQEFIEEQTCLLTESTGRNLNITTMMENDKIEQLERKIAIQALEIEVIKETLNLKNKETMSKKRVQKKFKKHPRIFNTPPTKHKRTNSVRFEIEDTNV